jgi:predicted outer membrane protein
VKPLVALAALALLLAAPAAQSRDQATYRIDHVADGDTVDSTT